MHESSKKKFTFLGVDVKLLHGQTITNLQI